MAIILGGLILLSILSIQFDLDRKIESIFFSDSRGWYLGEEQPWQFFYQYGTIPGVILSVMALLGYLVCQVNDRYRQWRHYFLLVVLTSIIGAGIMVNVILKPYWGRPRPSQTVEYGGALEYRPVYAPGEPGRGRSFSCGHSTMGFLFVSLFFFYRKSRIIAYGGLAAGLIGGSLLGLTRMLQGAHYLSDNIWSLGIILLTSTWLYYFVLRIPFVSTAPPSSPLSLRSKLLTGCCVGTVILIIVFAFLTRRPYYNLYQKMFYLISAPAEIKLYLNVPLEKKRVVYKDLTHPRLIIQSHGFGRPEARRSIDIERHLEGNALILNAIITETGYFAEIDHQVELWLPQNLKSTIHVDITGAKLSLTKRQQA